MLRGWENTDPVTVRLLPPPREHQVLTKVPSSDFWKHFSSLPASPDLGMNRWLRLPGKPIETVTSMQAIHWECPGLVAGGE